MLSWRPSSGVTAVSSACLCVRIWQSVLTTGRVSGFSRMVLWPSSLLLARAETPLISHHCSDGVNALSHPQMGIHGRWKCLQVLLLLTVLGIQRPSVHNVRTVLDGSSSVMQRNPNWFRNSLHGRMGKIDLIWYPRFTLSACSYLSVL